MKKSAEVVIIGGGINGCTIAYNLSRENIDTVLLEKGDLADGASGRCGAMIWSIWSDRPSKELAELGTITLERFAALEEELDSDLEYKTEDYLHIISPGTEAYFSEVMQNTKKNLGVCPEFLSPKEIKKMAPYIDVDNFPTVGAYHHCNRAAESSANHFLTVQALAANARRLGTEIYTDTEVTGIDVKNEKVEGVFTDKGKIRTHVVINAAGAWSADVARMAGVKIPTMPYHEEAIITEPLEPLPYYPLCSSTIWGRQTKSGQIISGEDYLQIQEPGYRTETTLDFLARITRVLQSMIPRLRNVNILRQWGGVEDITPDELPIVGEVDELEGLILACGCQGFGFCFSQAMGKLIIDLIVKHEKCEAMEKLSLRRFKKEYREYPGRWYGSRPN